MWAIADVVRRPAGVSIVALDSGGGPPREPEVVSGAGDSARAIGRIVGDFANVRARASALDEPLPVLGIWRRG